MKFPVVDITISLNELPDKVAVALVFGNCSRKCKGCHSDYLQTPIHTDLWQDLEVLKTKVQKQKDLGADTVVLMGGTTNGVDEKHLKELIIELSKILPVGIYSGLPLRALYNKFLMGIPELSYIKTGDYQEDKGGLDVEGSNQILWRRRPYLEGWENITSKLRKG